MPREDKKKLNKEQKEAVEHGKGPLLIISGAGTGKTTVITERIKYLISQGLAKSSEILALTFTDKAAREMEERVDIAMPYGYTDMWVLTFHSFCDKILRQEALQIGLDPGYKLLTEAETIQFLIKNLFKFDLNYFRPLGNPTKFIDGLIQHFSRLKDEDVSPELYRKYADQQMTGKQIAKEEKEKNLELAKAYQVYEELKVKEGIMDFADLIANTIRLFRVRKNILERYHQQFKYILVDEFQDTNFAQNELAILLTGAKQNLTVCADDDQSIYRWRGAAISNVIHFKKSFPKAKIVVLVRNYRSTQLILDHAYKLIQNNNPDRLEVKEKIDKHLIANRKTKDYPIDFLHADRVENEAEMVVTAIRGLTDGSVGKYEYGQMAILVRANNHAEAFSRALGRAGIPYQFLGPGQLLRQPEIKDLIAYFKLLYDFQDNVALFRVLSMDNFEVSGRDLAAITNYARRINISLFEACESVDKVFVSAQAKEKINRFTEMVHRHLGLMAKETAGQILYYFLEDTGILKKLTEYKSLADEKKAQNISKFFDRLKTYEVDHEDASVLAVVDWINLSMTLGESPLASNVDWFSENRVNVLTVHSSKGLEFPVVFLVNLVSARFPTPERKEKIPIPDALVKEILPEGDYHTQEERRLFYVGMTRACDRLYLTAADYYGEGKREKRISPFVIETLEEDAINNSPFGEASEQKQLSIFEYKPIEEVKISTTDVHVSINYLSYSQIETFNTCPLQYRYRYLQRIPVLQSAAASFGDTIHKTLAGFYQKIKEGKKLEEKDLLEVFSQNWSSVGYANKVHELKTKKKGEEMLRNFFKQGHNPKVGPKSLEQVFVVKVSPKLKVGGKIDRVDEINGRLEIIDYKTGKPWDEKKVASSLQMTVYAMAAADRGIYGRKPEDVDLSFYFLETGEKKSTKRTTEDLQKATKDLEKKAQEIEASTFEAKPSQMCDFCDYRLLCEAWS